ncbi:MAG: ketoacyl-ACP synthase III [Planctomycetaceae bacterium]|nr:ketoacyl-ACP synthase III [Planctomycetaceae bacterium]
MKSASIVSITYYLPEKKLGNRVLAELFSGWTEDKIARKLGIVERPIAAMNETAVDMAVLAAERLFDKGVCEPEEIDYVLLCTQSPDYLLPTSACIVHERLGLPKACGALDFNLGCSGYVYGLSLAKGLVEGGMAQNLLLLTSETYTKYINQLDRGSRPLFGDAAAATLIRGVDAVGQQGDVKIAEPSIGPFVFGTDGSGADLLIVPAGGHRSPVKTDDYIERSDGRGSVRSRVQLSMHGPGIFAFAIDRVPTAVRELLDKSGKTKDDIGCYVFHQANKYMLDKLRELCNIDEAKYYNDMAYRGNTVSSSIPIAMVDAFESGMLKTGESVMLVGFGVGLSWAAGLVVLPDCFC